MSMSWRRISLIFIFLAMSSSAQIAFEGSRLVVFDGVPSVTVSIVATEPVNSQLEFSVIALNGTAKSGIDFYSLNETIYQLTPNKTQIKIQIRFINDLYVINQREFYLVITSSVNSNVYDQMTIVILNSDIDYETTKPYQTRTLTQTKILNTITLTNYIDTDQDSSSTTFNVVWSTPVRVVSATATFSPTPTQSVFIVTSTATVTPTPVPVAFQTTVTDSGVALTTTIINQSGGFKTITPTVTPTPTATPSAPNTHPGSSGGGQQLVVHERSNYGWYVTLVVILVLIALFLMGSCVLYCLYAPRNREEYERLRKQQQETDSNQAAFTGMHDKSKMFDFHDNKPATIYLGKSNRNKLYDKIG